MMFSISTKAPSLPVWEQGPVVAAPYDVYRTHPHAALPICTFFSSYSKRIMYSHSIHGDVNQAWFQGHIRGTSSQIGRTAYASFQGFHGHAGHT